MFCANRSGGTVTGIDVGGGWNGAEKMLKTTDECPMVTAGKVCATDGETEEAVAGEEDVLGLAVEADTTGGVTGTGNHF